MASFTVQSPHQYYFTVGDTCSTVFNRNKIASFLNKIVPEETPLPCVHRKAIILAITFVIFVKLHYSLLS
jgi:hypothetical protein